MVYIVYHNSCPHDCYGKERNIGHPEPKINFVFGIFELKVFSKNFQYFVNYTLLVLGLLVVEKWKAN